MISDCLLLFPDEEEDENENNGSSKRKRALIYRLFEKQSDGRCMCVLCSKILSSTQGSTSALRRHASSFHWAEWEFLQSEAAANEQVGIYDKSRDIYLFFT